MSCCNSLICDKKFYGFFYYISIYLVRCLFKVLKNFYQYLHKYYIKLKEKIILQIVTNKQPVFGISSNNRNPKIIVSLTSYTKRFQTLDLCIKTLLNQTVKPNKIILYIANAEKNEVPRKILELKKYGLTIKYVENDLRPHKKYYYAMKEYSDCIIVTVDDDVLYDKHLIEKLLETHNRFPKAIVAGRARVINYDQNTFKPYNEWNLIENVERPSMNLLATGVGGVLYPPYLLNVDKLLDIDEINKYIYVDDLWLKTIEILSGIPTVLCNPKVDRKRIVIPVAQKNGLTQKNVFENQNDMYWEKLNSEFDLLDKINQFREEDNE